MLSGAPGRRQAAGAVRWRYAAGRRPGRPGSGRRQPRSSVRAGAAGIASEVGLAVPRDSSGLVRRTLPSTKAKAERRAAARGAPLRRALDLRPERVLARGAECELVLASHRNGDELEVLKGLRTDRGADTEVVARFAREVEIATALHGPGLLPACRVWRSSGIVMLQMPCVLGPDAWTFLIECERRGRVPGFPSILPPALQIGAALAAMHEGQAGLPPCSHGNVSAGNVLLSMDGRCHLVDFGSVATTEENPAGPRSDLRQLGLLVAAWRAGRLPGSVVPPEPGPVTPNIALGADERAFDRLVARCVHPEERGGFRCVRDFLDALGALTPAGLREDAALALARELEHLFGPPHRGRAFGAGFFRPPMLPMLLSWMPPAPRLAAACPSPPPDAPPRPAAEHDEITQPMRAVSAGRGWIDPHASATTTPGTAPVGGGGDGLPEVDLWAEVALTDPAVRSVASEGSEPGPPPADEVATDAMPRRLPPGGPASAPEVAPVPRLRATRPAVALWVVATGAFLAGAVLVWLLLGLVWR